MGKIKNILKIVNELDSKPVQSITKDDEDQLKTFDIEVYAPRYPVLYQTVLIPNPYNNKVIEHSIKLTKIINKKRVVYDLICYRYTYDIGQFLIGFNLTVDNTLSYSINFPFTPPQFIKLIDWFEPLLDLDTFDGTFKLIMDDFVKVKIEDAKYYITFPVIVNVDLEYLELNKNDFTTFLYQLGILLSKIGANPSVFDYYREYE